jgi:hypothetical protein
MTVFLPGLGDNGGERKPSAFDYLTRLLLPALALVAMILTREHTRLSWALLALTVLFLGIGFYPAARAGLRRRLQHREDKRVARGALPEFRRLVGRFGDFVNTSTNDTLHYILQNEACQGFTDRYTRLGIPELGLWSAFWSHLAQRVDRQQLSPSGLQYALQEFYSLVGLYDTTCVIRIFNNPPPEFRGGLTPAAKNSLNLFQQRFERFLANYEDFAKGLAESRPAFQNLPRHFSHPKPL